VAALATVKSGAGGRVEPSGTSGFLPSPAPARRYAGACVGARWPDETRPAEPREVEQGQETVGSPYTATLAGGGQRRALLPDRKPIALAFVDTEASTLKRKRRTSG
jgi:hypothetical protein